MTQQRAQNTAHKQQRKPTYSIQEGIRDCKVFAY